MIKPQTRYIFSLKFGTVILCAVVSFGIISLWQGGGSLRSPASLLCLGVLPLGCIMWEWARLLRGRTLFESRDRLPLNGGKMSFAEPTCPYEIWLFCEEPFLRYRGSVLISTDDRSNDPHVIKIPHGFQYLDRVRSNFAPIIARPRGRGQGPPSQCQITFKLLPRYQCDQVRPDTKLVTAVVRSLARSEEGERRWPITP